MKTLIKSCTLAALILVINLVSGTQKSFAGSEDLSSLEKIETYIKFVASAPESTLSVKANSDLFKYSLMITDLNFNTLLSKGEISESDALDFLKKLFQKNNLEQIFALKLMKNMNFTRIDCQEFRVSVKKYILSSLNSETDSWLEKNKVLIAIEALDWNRDQELHVAAIDASNRMSNDVRATYALLHYYKTQRLIPEDFIKKTLNSPDVLMKSRVIDLLATHPNEIYLKYVNEILLSSEAGQEEVKAIESLVKSWPESLVERLIKKLTAADQWKSRLIILNGLRGRLVESKYIIEFVAIETFDAFISSRVGAHRYFLGVNANEIVLNEGLDFLTANTTFESIPMLKILSYGKSLKPDLLKRLELWRSSLTPFQENYYLTSGSRQEITFRYQNKLIVRECDRMLQIN